MGCEPKILPLSPFGFRGPRMRGSASYRMDTRSGWFPMASGGGFTREPVNVARLKRLTKVRPVRKPVGPLSVNAENGLTIGATHSPLRIDSVLHDDLNRQKHCDDNAAHDDSQEDNHDRLEQ